MHTINKRTGPNKASIENKYATVTFIRHSRVLINNYNMAIVTFIGRKEGRKEGTCLFDINDHNTKYISVKILSGDSN